MALTVLRDVARRVGRAIVVQVVPESVARDVLSRGALGILIEETHQAWEQREG
jgi:hypothetical protein